MAIAGLIAGLMCVIAWLYLLLAHGKFWRMPLIPNRTAPSSGAVESKNPGHNLAATRALPLSAGFADAVGRGRTIAVIIPARNEADVIGHAVASLLRQQPLTACHPERSAAEARDLSSHKVEVHVFVVDDNSTDGTSDAAQWAGGNDRLTIIPGQPLAPGWSGKLWALEQGVEQALALHPDFLLFTDADVEHAPDNLATLVSVAEAGNYDLASFMVQLHCRTLPERLLIPAFVFFFFLLYPPQWIRDPRRRTAGAAGGCILIRPAALERIGGIAAIRREIIDDCALARAVKQTGGKVWLGLTAATHSLRPYNSFAEVERMIARTAFNQLRHSAWLLLGCVVGMLLIFVITVALLASGSAQLVTLGAIAYLLMTIAYVPMVRYYRLAPLWALTLPFSAVFYTAATVHSAMKYWAGRGGEWKGRAQDTGA